MTGAKTEALNVPGAILRYDIRDAETAPVLLMIGSPMGAAGFGTLAGHFADRTVVTTTRAEWLISALDAAPVDIFARSGPMMGPPRPVQAQVRRRLVDATEDAEVSWRQEVIGACAL